MNKILILKNDRVGDLFNSLDGINAIIYDNPNSKIEIILSNVTHKLSFLFNLKNVTVSYLPYKLGIVDKFKLFFKIFKNSFEKIYILAPKNFYFYLPIFFKSKFFAISIKNFNKSRPSQFLLNQLHSYKVNNRENKKINECINNLIFDLCAKNSRTYYKNILNNIPPCSKFFTSKLNLFKNFIHIHYKESIFKKNNWTNDNFFKLLDVLSNENKIMLTSDYGNFDYQKYFLSRFSHLDFTNIKDNIKDDEKIHYLHNINTIDLFKMISYAKLIISPHGAMTVMASYFQKKVIDIFDTNIDIKAFREYKPINNQYEFLILRSDSDKVLKKICKFL